MNCQNGQKGLIAQSIVRLLYEMPFPPESHGYNIASTVSHRFAGTDQKILRGSKPSPGKVLELSIREVLRKSVNVRFEPLPYDSNQRVWQVPLKSTLTLECVQGLILRMVQSGVSKTLRSGALAKSAGVSPDTIRHYEKIGVLPRASRTDSGYRVYPPSALEKSFCRAKGT